MWGAVLGGALGAGLLLVVARLRVLGRAQLSDRVLPYVRDLPQVAPTAAPSRHPAPPLLGAAVAVYGPVLRALADAVERVLGGATSVRRRLERAGLDLTVHDIRVEQVVWGLVGFGVTAAWGLLRTLGGGGNVVGHLLICAVTFTLGVLARDTYLTSQVRARERRILAEFPTVAELLEDCRAAVVGEAVDARPPVRSQAAYDALLTAVRGDLEARVRGVLADVVRVLTAWRGVEKDLSGRADMAMLPALTDMRAQLARLVDRGFVGEAGPTQLRRFPVYLAALSQRREKLLEGGGSVGRDRQLMDRIADLQDAWLHQVDALPDGRPLPERLREARWMLEEYRISLWAQQLGTAHPVSDQRIRKVLG
jgi:hypothetical protein